MIPPQVVPPATVRVLVTGPCAQRPAPVRVTPAPVAVVRAVPLQPVRDEAPRRRTLAQAQAALRHAG